MLMNNMWKHVLYRMDNIYICIAFTLDETDILVAVHLSMKNIYQSCDLGRAFGRSDVDVRQ